ncbi:hypothetical protein [Aliarcobacter cryaerophilus]|uniref:hypothetical protein n=1 Tax=Aliarcobacter cryaerophilus TaxID=28198 RepID=UPI0011DFD838|nr:hypothetical protein [Aliarcobacter cryaerophilus]
MENNIFSRTNILLTSIIAIFFGIFVILDPSLVEYKWGDKNGESSLLVGTGYIIIGSIVAIVQAISIYRSSKKDKKENK